MSFGRIVARAFLPKLVLLAAAFAWVAPACLMPSWDAGGSAEVMAIRPHVDNSPAALIAENECWTGAAPSDVTMPGHVVVSVDGVARVGGPRLVGQALEQVFDGVDHGMVVHAFCE